MLLLPGFDYEEPEGLQEALRILSEMQSEARIIAGGTDLIVNMKKKAVSPACLVSLKRIGALRGIERKKNRIEIGSYATVTDIACSGLIADHFPVLRKAALSLGSPLIRNRATIGGNVATARPAADLPPALMALGAKIKLKSKGRQRTVAPDTFFTGPGMSILLDDEIITVISIDEPPPFTGADYIKLGHRAALEIAIVAVASRVTLDEPGGIIRDARIVLSAVAPTAVRALSAEGALLGERPSEGLFAKAASLAVNDSSPIDDMRGGAGYRRDMVKVLTERTLMNALREAQGADGGLKS